MKHLKIILVGMLISSLEARELQWNWNEIDLDDISFSKDFFWGCSDSALQTEGLVTATSSKRAINSWTLLEEQLNIADDERVGSSCERWTRFKEDIQLMADLGMTMYRFSIDWSKIEPEEGLFDDEVLAHYEEEIDEMLRQGITPMITLLHHVLPAWFEKKGGFEHEANADSFKKYAEYVFNRFHTKVKFWILINEPIAYAIEAYWRGNYYPAKKSFKLAGQVAFNLLNAHVLVSRSLKSIDATAQIGIAHIIQPLDAYHDWHPLEKIGAKMFDHVVNNLLIRFFRTGKFNWLMFARGSNSEAPGSLDFFGVNYYSHSTIKHSSIFKMGPVARPDDVILTPIEDDQRGCKVLYAEGLYRAIKRAAQLNLPIYITENGSSTDNKELTELYHKKHLYALSKAMKEGYNVRGYLLWTLVDSFGWRKAYRAKHGIYEVDFATQERKYRPAFDYLVSVINKHKQEQE